MLLIRKAHETALNIKNRVLGFPLIESLKCNKGHTTFIILSEKKHDFLYNNYGVDSNSGSANERADPKNARKIVENLKPRLSKGNCQIIIDGKEPLSNLEFIYPLVNEADYILNKEINEIEYLNKIIILTNGTKVPSKEEFLILRKMKNKIVIVYFDDDLHQVNLDFSVALMHEGIDVLSMSSIINSKNTPIASKFDEYMDELNTDKCCEANGLRYIKNGNSIYVSRSFFESLEKQFQIDEKGNVYICTVGGLVIGNILEKRIDEIAKIMQNDPFILSLIQRGPLGLAEMMHYGTEAIEIYLKKGPCGVCHYLSEQKRREKNV